VLVDYVSLDENGRGGASHLPIAFPELDLTPMKFTQMDVNRLTLPAGKTDVIVFDSEVPGLGLRLRIGGRRRVWVFQYQIGTKSRRMTLGVTSAINLATARRTATDFTPRFDWVRTQQHPNARTSAAPSTSSKRRFNHSSTKGSQRCGPTATCRWSAIC
jgi:hypothetical protein